MALFSSTDHKTKIRAAAEKFLMEIPKKIDSTSESKQFRITLSSSESICTHQNRTYFYLLTSSYVDYQPHLAYQYPWSISIEIAFAQHLYHGSSQEADFDVCSALQRCIASVLSSAAMQRYLELISNTLLSSIEDVQSFVLTCYYLELLDCCYTTYLETELHSKRLVRGKVWAK